MDKLQQHTANTDAEPLRDMESSRDTESCPGVFTTACHASPDASDAAKSSGTGSHAPRNAIEVFSSSGASACGVAATREAAEAGVASCSEVDLASLAGAASLFDRRVRDPLWTHSQTPLAPPHPILCHTLTPLTIFDSHLLSQNIVPCYGGTYHTIP